MWRWEDGVVRTATLVQAAVPLPSRLDSTACLGPASHSDESAIFTGDATLPVVMSLLGTPIARRGSVASKPTRLVPKSRAST